MADTLLSIKTTLLCHLLICSEVSTSYGLNPCVGSYGTTPGTTLELLLLACCCRSSLEDVLLDVGSWPESGVLLSDGSTEICNRVKSHHTNECRQIFYNFPVSYLYEYGRTSDVHKSPKSNSLCNGYWPKKLYKLRLFFAVSIMKTGQNIFKSVIEAIEIHLTFFFFRLINTTIVGKFFAK